MSIILTSLFVHIWIHFNIFHNQRQHWIVLFQKWTSFFFHLSYFKFIYSAKLLTRSKTFTVWKTSFQYLHTIFSFCIFLAKFIWNSKRNFSLHIFFCSSWASKLIIQFRWKHFSKRRILFIEDESLKYLTLLHEVYVKSSLMNSFILESVINY